MLQRICVLTTLMVLLWAMSSPMSATSRCRMRH